jgi:enamine deaminase RidA (YjgF/YER057c/UK114 family)
VQCVPAPAGAGPHQQVTAALAAVEDALRAAQMTPLDIDRTWFFVADIGHTYAELNAARDAAFDRWGVRLYPASTGIGAVLPAGTAVSVMVEASSVTPAGGKELTALGTPLQAAPADYGSRFVRGNRLRLSGRHTVNISGISSIDGDGRSILSADPADCIGYAMRSLLDILGSGEATIADIRSAYVYCADGAVQEAFSSYLAGNGLNFPHLLTYAPVCRPELIFEIEARAVRSQL